MKYRNNRNSQSGFSLMELMVVIGIIAVLVIGVLTYKAMAKGDSNVSRETDNVSVIISKIQRLKGGASYGASGADLLPIAINANAVPKSMSIVGSTVTNVWGGAVTIKSTGNGFYVNYAGVPKEACLAMAGAIAGSTDTTTAINGGAPISGAIDPIVANTQCNADPSSLQWNVLN